ncbi:MAG: hypothetical protein ABL931_22305, partial [Usitatibacteraceae bacterium]
MPVGVVTLILPVVAVAGTVACKEVAVIALTPVLATPLNFTLVAPVRLVPVTVTVLPDCPLAGEKLVTVGGGTGPVDTEKSVADVTVPADVVTLILPVAAPVGTVTASPV